jgi:alpha-tubulin suppressor-like RCC1 family protein
MNTEVRRRASLLAVVPLLIAGISWAASPAHAQLYGGYADWKVVSAGSTQTCATRSTGQLYCWNTDGSGSALYPFNSAADWRTVSVGGAHACAIRGTGLLYCWGSDASGQVGDGAGTGSGLRRVGSATNWKSVSAGDSHTCGIRSDGRLYCWGSDAFGQIGNGSGGSPTSPAQITSSATWSTVSAGGSHTCAIRAGGILYCWGHNANSQIGDWGTNDIDVPERITSATDWKSVTAGQGHTCAVRGKLYCWGDDGQGQVGDGSNTNPVRAPKQITSATDWRSASAGGSHTCAIRAQGQLYCWGGNDAHQAVETSDSGTIDYPQRVGSYYDWTATNTGLRHTCATRTTGWLYCWGAQIRPSTGTPAGSAYPAQVSGVDGLRAWKLTTPIDANGDAVADEIKQPTLATYRNLAFFHTNADNSAIVFRAPVGGAKTSGSVYARSELRNMKRYDGTAPADEYDWTSGTHELTMNEAFTHLPAKLPRVVGMQIHDPSHQVLEIFLDGPRLYAVVRRPDGSNWDITLDGAYRLGTFFTLKVTANGSGIFVDYNGVRAASFAGRLPDPGTNTYWFFKAGCYLQTNTAKGDAPNDYGEVLIKKLVVTHNGQQI